VTNKNGNGKKKTLVACIKGTKSQDIIDVISKIPLEKRKLVKEITLDMANNMQLAFTDLFSRSFSSHRPISCSKTSYGCASTCTNKVQME